MRKFLLLSFILMALAISSFSQVSVTATAGTANATYTTLGSAFNAINAGTHKGIITITLTANTTEATTAKLDSSGNPTTSSYTYISIKPAAATAVTISGSASGIPLIDLNGADGVVVDGLNTGGASLTINNTDIISASSSTLRLINDASNNKFYNLTIKGSAPSTTATAAGTVFISTGLLTGNDGNRFENCNIDGTGTASITFCSTGSTANSSIENSLDTISNCKVYDFFNSAVASNWGVVINIGNTDWTIMNNSIYQTVTRTLAANTIFYGLYTAPAFTTDKNKVTGNYVGGSSALGAGTMTLTGTGAAIVGFFGIYVNTGGTGDVVDNNIVKNVSLSYASASSYGSAGIYGYVGGFDGTPSYTNNQVRDLTFTNNLAGGYISFSAFYMNGRPSSTGTTVTPVFTITNNTVTNIVANSSGTADFQFYGMRLEASSPNSFTSTTVYSKPIFNASGNQVNTMALNTTGTSAFLRGIAVISTNGTSSTSPLWPKGNITNNTVYGLSNGGNLASYSTGAVTGIHIGGSANINNTTDIHTVSGNTIYNLSSTTTGDVSNNVAGIICSNGIWTVEKNKIYGLSNSSVGTVGVPIVAGINPRFSFGASSIRNNFISLGASQSTATNFFGIVNNASATGTLDVYYNAVYMAGVGSTRNSVGLYRGNEAMTGAITTTMTIKNNILYNTRAVGSNYAIGSYGTGTWTSDYNVLVNSSNVNTIAFWNNANNNLATYKTNSGDVNSRNTTVNFVNVATADLHLTGASNGDINLKGTAVAGITTDYDGQTRSTWSPYIGADEASIVLPVQSLSFSGYRDGKINKLQWSTSSEINNKGFDLERSADGKNFSSITFVTSKADRGNSSSTLNYNFTDEKSFSGTNYYRLKQLDNDGKFSYSSVVVLKGDKVFDISALYPNPVKDQLNLAVSASRNEKASISIVDISGKVLKTISTSLIPGDNNISINVSALATGTYFIRLVNTENEISSVQFIKN